MAIEDMSNEEIIIALEDKANSQPLWNSTAQLYAEAATRIKKLNEG